ncbi:MAG: hypothetical protein ACKVIK_02115 [Rhodospirillales bacterium]|jgi:hypothetical protein
MKANLERDDFINLLGQLNSDDDAEILGAVRDLNAKMTVAGMTWDDLLISQGDTAEVTLSEDEDSAIDQGIEDSAIDQEDEESDIDQEDKGSDNLEPLSDDEKEEAGSLISAIGGMEISNMTKQELEEYAADIKSGDFEKMDLRYLRALKSRLSA